MKCYIGQRLEPSTAGDCLVEVSDTGEDADRRPLPPRNDLRDHSTTGFSWGYGGSGPAQLALAILADYLGDDFEAVRQYRQFLIKEVAILDVDHGWKMSAASIEAYFAEVGYKRPTVRDLLEGDDYQFGRAAIEYVEEGRGLCRAFINRFGCQVVRVMVAGLEHRLPIAAVLDQRAKLVRHNGDGGDPLPQASR